MKKLMFILVLVHLTISIQSQSWTYNQGNDVFDGPYKVCSIIGEGYEFPYKTPLFVVNVFNGKLTSPNIYLKAVPSTHCENNRIKIKFDNDTIIFQPKITTNEKKDTWFLKFEDPEIVAWIKEHWGADDKSVGYTGSVEEFINEMKIHSKMYIRLQSDCVKSDFEFSLKGSSVALNNVFNK